MQRLIASIAVASLWAVSAALVHADDPDTRDVRLVLQLTVDGFRRDLLSRYAGRFGEGGFRYLLDEGVLYADAHYQHSNTETIVGHTTLATGAFPADHGMTGNAWYHRDTGEFGYNIEDAQHLPLASRADPQAGAQVDPAQLAANTPGRSPVNILAETFADRLAVHFGGRSKLFAVSGKDRGAVAMAGKSGKAFWFSSDTGDFVTSSYYYKAYPDWAQSWNEERKAEALGGSQWTLLNEPSTYLLAHQDDRPFEVDLRGYGRVFPHTFAATGNPLLPTQVLVSPHGDRLTADFAKALFDAEGLGQDGVPDYLSVSFSGVDAVNHFFGPSSLENEDMVLQLDRTLADLLAFIDDRVGLEHTLIVLSADHGMAEMPEHMATLGFGTGRLYSEQVVDEANALGERLFGVEAVTRFFFRPWLYLDTDRIEAAGHDPDEVRQALAEQLEGVEGVAHAVNRERLQGPLATGMLGQLQRNFHPARSGDIYIVQAPYWFNFEKGPIAAMHGSPWRYDTHVPIIFAGLDIERQTVNRRVHPVDVAPTLAAFLGMSAPGSSSGTVLVEALNPAGSN